MTAVRQRPNWVAGQSFSALWLLIVLAPVYVLVKAAFQTQAAYSAHGPLSAPTDLTLEQLLARLPQRVPALLPEHGDHHRRAWW